MGARGPMLTPAAQDLRDLLVVQLLADGWTYVQITDRFNITSPTITAAAKGLKEAG